MPSGGAGAATAGAPVVRGYHHGLGSKQPKVSPLGRTSDEGAAALLLGDSPTRQAFAASAPAFVRAAPDKALVVDAVILRALLLPHALPTADFLEYDRATNVCDGKWLLDFLDLVMARMPSREAPDQPDTFVMKFDDAVRTGLAEGAITDADRTLSVAHSISIGFFSEAADGSLDESVRDLVAEPCGLTYRALYTGVHGARVVRTLELMLGPYADTCDRLHATAKATLARLLTAARMEAEDLADLTDAEKWSEGLTELGHRLPPRELALFGGAWGERRVYIRTMLTPEARVSGAALDHSNVLRAVAHLPALRALLDGANAAEAWAAICALMAKFGLPGAPSLGALKLVVPRIDHLCARFESEAGMPPDARVAGALAALAERDIERAIGAGATAKSFEGETTLGEKAPNRWGYSRAHADFITKLTSTPRFIEQTARIDAAMAGVRSGTNHPMAVISTALSCTRVEGGGPETLFWHALAGVTDGLPGVPVIKELADVYRDHVASFLGKVGFERILPAAMQEPEFDDGKYPVLTPLWEAWRVGNVSAEYENLFLFAVCNFYAGGDLKTPPSECFKDPSVLRRLVSLCGPEGLFGVLGYKLEPSFASACSSAVDFFDEAVMLSAPVRAGHIRAYLTGILAERSVLNMRAIRARDPEYVIGGALVVPASQSTLTFTQTRAEAGQCYKLGRQLLTLGVTANAAQAARPVAVAEEEEIGRYASRVKGDLAKNSLTLENREGEVVASWKLKETIEALPKSPDGGTACLGCAVSASAKPWMYCIYGTSLWEQCQPLGLPSPSAKEAQRHTTKQGAAHAGNKKWKASKLAPLIIMAAGLSSQGANAMPPKSHVSARAFYAAQSPLPPAVRMPAQVSSHLFTPLLFAAGNAYVGIAPEPGSLFGDVLPIGGRDVVNAQAKRWSASLFATEKVAPYYLFEDEPPSPAQDVVSGIALSAALVDFEAHFISDPLELADLGPGGDIRFAGLDVLRAAADRWPAQPCWPRMVQVASFAFARILRFVRPCAAMPVGAKVGAMGERFVAPQRVLIDSVRQRTIDRDTLMERMAAESEAVQQELRDALAGTDMESWLRTDLECWLEVARRPPPLGEVEESLWAVACEATDPRLADLPLPSGARPVHTAPLPPRPPPPVGFYVPEGTCSLEECFTPAVARGFRRALKAVHAYLLLLAEVEARGGDAEEVPRPVLSGTRDSYFAVGPEGLRAWARVIVEAGGVLELADGAVRVRDSSRPPHFTLHPDYWGRILGHSPDHALRDAMTTHGIVHHAWSLEPVCVVVAPSPSLVKGFSAVLRSVVAMAADGLFDIGAGADGFCIPSVPCRFQVVLCVPKALTGEWRMCVDNGWPYQGECATMGKRMPIRSLNLATGARASRSWVRVARALAVKALPPSAFGIQRQQERDRRDAQLAAPRRLRGLTREEARKPFRGPVDMDVTPGSPGGPVLPPEHKAYFWHLMQAVCYYGYVGSLCDQFPVLVGDDFRKAFYQWALSPEQWWTCCQFTLEPDAFERMHAGGGPPELRYVQEKCMSMGTAPSSSWCQRALTEFCIHVESEVEKRVQQKVEDLCVQFPALAQHLQRRRVLSASTGSDEARMCWFRPYSDDPAGVTLNCFLVDTLVVWGTECRASGLVRGVPVKRSLGNHMCWVGGGVISTGLLAYIPKDKALRASKKLLLAMAGALSVTELYEMTGLLHHLIQLLGLPKWTVYAIFDGLDRMREESDIPLRGDERVFVTERSARAFKAVRAALLTQAGGSLLSSIFVAAPQVGEVAWRPSCDAAIKGTSFPAIAMVLYSEYCQVALTQEWASWPIVALEFAGEAPLMLLTFGETLSGAELVGLPCDSLVAPTILSSAAKGSALMVFMHEEFMKLPIFEQLREKLFVYHEYGVGNALADWISRGDEPAARAAARHMGVSLSQVHLPRSGLDYMMKVGLRFRELEQREREIACALPSRRLNAAAAAGKHATSVQLGVAAQAVVAPDMPIAERSWLCAAMTVLTPRWRFLTLAGCFLRRAAATSYQDESRAAAGTAGKASAPWRIAECVDLYDALASALMDPPRFQLRRLKRLAAALGAKDPSAAVLNALSAALVAAVGGAGLHGSTAHLARYDAAYRAYREWLRRLEELTAMCDALEMAGSGRVPSLPLAAGLDAALGSWGAVAVAATSTRRSAVDGPRGGFVGAGAHVQLLVTERNASVAARSRHGTSVHLHNAADAVAQADYSLAPPVALTGEPLPCPKCGVSCAGELALEMHVGVCCGPLVEAAPLTAEQAARLERLAVRSGGRGSVGVTLVPMLEDPLQLLATQAATVRQLPGAPTTPSMIIENGYVCVGPLHPAGAVIPPGSSAASALGWPPGLCRDEWRLDADAFLPRSIEVGLGGLPQGLTDGVSLFLHPLVLATHPQFALLPQYIASEAAGPSPPSSPPVHMHSDVESGVLLDTSLPAREVGLGAGVREVDSEPSTHAWCLGGGMAVAAVHVLMAVIGLVCGAAGRLGQRGQGWKVCVAVLAAVVPGAEAVPSEFASYLSTRSAGGPGPSHRATSARPPVGQPLGAGRVTAQGRSSQMHEMGMQSSSALSHLHKREGDSLARRCIVDHSFPLAPRLTDGAVESLAESTPRYPIPPTRDVVIRVPQAPKVVPARPTTQVRTDHLGRDSAVRVAAGWEDALLQDPSPFAIMPGRPEDLAALLCTMREHLDLAYAHQTNRTDQSHLKAWKEACAELGTPCWRTDMAANMGFDPVGYRRELLVTALAFMIMYPKMIPRAKKDRGKGCNPRNCLLKLYAVAREHKKRGFQMAPLSLVMKVMAGMMHRYVLINGTDSLTPARKNPLTNEMIDAMIGLEEGASAEGFSFVVRWHDAFWQGVLATIVVLAETGMRKSDVSKPTEATPFARGRLTFDSLRWKIGAVLVVTMTLACLDMLGGDATDGCWLVYGAMKNDAYGEHFGAKPSWLPYNAHDRRNACHALAQLERNALLRGVVGSKRGDTPLFGPHVGVEWHHSLLESVFNFLLAAGCKLDKAGRYPFSLHSFRIFLACALYAAGCPNDRIMAILRWRSEESLAIYARLNDDERARWIAKGRLQVVNSSSAEHLPRVDPDAYVASFYDSMGDLERMAAAADAGEEPAGVEGEEQAPGAAGALNAVARPAITVTRKSPQPKRRSLPATGTLPGSPLARAPPGVTAGVGDTLHVSRSADWRRMTAGLLGLNVAGVVRLVHAVGPPGGAAPGPEMVRETILPFGHGPSADVVQRFTDGVAALPSRGRASRFSNPVLGRLESVTGALEGS